MTRKLYKVVKEWHICTIKWADLTKLRTNSSEYLKYNN